MKNFGSHGAFQSNERLIKLFHLLNSGRTFTVVTLWTPLNLCWGWYKDSSKEAHGFCLLISTSVFTYWLVIQRPFHFISDGFHISYFGVRNQHQCFFWFFSLTKQIYFVLSTKIFKLFMNVGCNHVFIYFSLYFFLSFNLSLPSLPLFFLVLLCLFFWFWRCLKYIQ